MSNRRTTSPAARRLRHALDRLRPVAAASMLVLAGMASATDYYWGSGAYSSSGVPGTVTLNDTLAIQCVPGDCGTKILDGSLLNNGNIYATDTLYFQFTSQVLTNAWVYQLQADVGLQNVYAGGTFVNESSGVLVKTGGAGTSLINISSQHKSGSIVDAVSGRIEFAGAASFESGAILKANIGTQIAFTGGGLSLASGAKLLGDGQFLIGTNTDVAGDLGATQLSFIAGTYTGTGARLVSDAQWTGSGTFAGDWTISSGHTLTATGGGNRYIGGVITNQGTLATDGNLYFTYASHQILNSGTLNLQGDVGLSTVYAGGTLVNTGTLSKASGTGTSAISSIDVTNNGGTIDAQSGTLRFSGGSLTFNDGTRFTGAGQVVVASNAQFTGRIDTANLVLSGASFNGGDGSAHPTADVHGRTTITGGSSLTGHWTFAADHQLTLDTGSSLYIRGTVDNAGSFDAKSNIYFEYPSYVLNNTGTMTLAGGAGLYNVYAGGSFNNSGTLTVNPGSGGTSVISGITTGVTGNVALTSGTLTFTGGSLDLAATARLTAAAGTTLVMGGTNTIADGASLLGDGSFQIAGNSTVLGNLGANHLSFTQGTYTGGDGTPGSHATLTTDASWTGNGIFAGAWTVSGGTTLTATGAGNRYLRGTIDNQGTFDTDGNLYFEYPAYQITNSGTIKLRGDVGLINVYAGGTVVNTGTLAKVAGTDVSQLQGINFTNNAGTIDVQTGTLKFSGGALQFNDGTQFTGAGQAVVASSAQFAGRIDAANLTLTGAAFTGGDGGLQPLATLHGKTTINAATLYGQWTFAADHQLTLSGGSYVRGTVVNQGIATMTGDLYFEYPSYSLTNAGRLELKGDVGLINVYVGGTVVNTGTLVKTEGTGISSLSSVSLTNTGTIEAQVGTIALPANFVNAGTLKGNGAFQAGTLTNEGHIAPGASPGTLTLNSSLVLGSPGSLDIELNSAALHDLLVVSGNVTLGGTLALSCYGTCSFAAGTDVMVLDAAGTLTGDFSQVTLDGFATGAFEVHVDAANADVWLHVTQDVTAAVPEPSTYALLLGGLGLLAARRRRQA